MRSASIGVLGLLVLAAALTVGCDSNTTVPPPATPSKYLPQSSPANCLENLKTA